MYKVKILQENSQDFYPAVIAEGVVMGNGDNLEQYASDIEAIAAQAAYRAGNAETKANEAEKDALLAETYSKAVKDALVKFSLSGNPSDEVVAQVLDNTGNLGSIVVRIETIEEKVKCFDGTYNALADLDIIDPKGKVLARFDDGHFEVKKFDSRTAAVCANESSSSLDICDQRGNVIVRFANGHIYTKNFDSTQAGGGSSAGLKITDDGRGNLDIADQMGNVILRLENGHIKTKYFDSSNIDGTGSGGSSTPSQPSSGYDVISSFKGKRLAILGDSISTFKDTMPSGAYGSYYPTNDGDVDSVSKIWWHRVCTTLGMKYTNCSISGSTVCTDTNHNSTHDAGNNSPFAGCSTKRVNDLGINGTPDIVICFISVNDFGRGNNYSHPLGTWSITSSIPTGNEVTTVRAAYAMMINKIQTTYKNARIFCCSILDTITYDKTSGWPTNNSDGVSAYEWNKSLQEVAEALGATWLDMHGCGLNYANIRNYCVDEGLHPNAAGHKKMADFITKQLIANY